MSAAARISAIASSRSEADMWSGWSGFIV
jgi:hypothetical protein